MAQALEFAALGLQAQAGCPVTFSRTAQTIEAGTYQVVVEYSEEAVGRLAFELAQDLCRAAVDDQPFDLDEALDRLRELDEDVRLGPSTGAIVYAAVARRIPYRRLTEGSMVQFGWGSKQRRIQAAETDRTSAVAESIAQDKELSKILLHAAGVPVPGGRPVLSAEDAWAAACEIGGPVVVKPQDGNQGKGVAVNLTTREQIEAAYAIAFEVSDEVLVERYLPGHDYRMLVVGNKLVAAARREPPLVIGDGVHSIRQLVELVNQRPAARRRPRHLADQDPLRRGRAGPPGQRRPDAGIDPGQRPARRPAQQCQPVDRRHGHRRHRRRSSRFRRTRRRCRTNHRTRHRRRRHRLRQRPAARSRNRAAASSNSTPRPACACTCNRRSARAVRSAKRSSPTCLPTATTRAFRWSPWPAPTARRLPCA